MFTRNRFNFFPSGLNEWKSDGPRLVRAISDWINGLESPGAITITEGTEVGAESLNLGGSPIAHRNRIIGGDFTVNPWCRGTTFAAIATGAYSADRFRVDFVTSAVVTAQKTADAPTADEAGGYTAHCLDIDVTTADSSIASTDFFTVSQRIEGLNSAWFGFGQSGQRYVTLSFWVKSTKTGTFCASLRNSATNRAYVKEYTVSASNTWEKKTLTFPVDTGGTWLYDTGIGLTVSWALAAGSNFQTAADAWAAGNYVATSSQVNALDSTSNNFKLALVQLEPGRSSGAFEWRDKAVEDKLCGRYAMGLNSEYIGYFLNGSVGYSGMIMYPSEMRIAPSLETGATFTVTGGAAGTPGLAFTTTKMTQVYNTAGTWTANNAGTIAGTLTAEL